MTCFAGKTALVGVFSNKEYTETYTPTIFDNKIVGIQYKQTWINLGKLLGSNSLSTDPKISQF